MSKKYTYQRKSKYARGQKDYIIFDENGYVLEAKGFNFLIWSSKINEEVDKELVGKHVDEVAEMLKKNGGSKIEYLEYEAYIHLEFLKEMLNNLKN